MNTQILNTRHDQLYLRKRQSEVTVGIVGGFFLVCLFLFLIKDQIFQNQKHFGRTRNMINSDKGIQSFLSSQFSFVFVS